MTQSLSLQSLKKTPRVETFGRQKNRKNCVSRRSKSRKMNLYKDKFDAVRRNPYSAMYVINYPADI